MNKETLIKTVKEASVKKDTHVDQEIDKLLAEKELYREKFEDLETGLHIVYEALESEKLELQDIHYTLNEGAEIWSVSIIVIPRGTKHRHIANEGFTSRGVGRNNKKLVAKAEKLDSVLREKTGFNCSTNHYFFEKKDKGTNRLLIDIRI